MKTSAAAQTAAPISGPQACMTTSPPWLDEHQLAVLLVDLDRVAVVVAAFE